MQQVERHAAVPPVPVVEGCWLYGGGLVAALEDDGDGHDLLAERHGLGQRVLGEAGDPVDRDDDDGAFRLGLPGSSSMRRSLAARS